MPTTLSQTWFQPLREVDDLVVLTHPADESLWRLRTFMYECELLALLQEQPIGNTEHDLLLLFEDAQQELGRDNSMIRDHVFVKPEPRDIRNYRQRQQQAALGPGSLLVQVKVLEELYKRFMDALRRTGRSLTDALRRSIGAVRHALRAFFGYLNKLLYSIKHVLPPIEAMKALKDVTEASLDL